MSPEIPLPNFCQPSKVCPKSPGCTDVQCSAGCTGCTSLTLPLYLRVFSRIFNSFQLTVTSHRATKKTAIMSSVSSTLISSLLLTNLATTMASVAVGLGQINPGKKETKRKSYVSTLYVICPGNPSECIDPDTGLSHPLGSSWGVAGCGQASCDLRQGTVFMSYS